MTPMLLGFAREPFDDRNYLYELKLDGFRALAIVDGERVQLVSRRGHAFRGFESVSAALRAAVRPYHAVLDGELVCLDNEGRPVFRPLLARRGHCYFYAFDVLAVNGEDLRDRRLIDRKRRLRGMLRRSDRIRFLGHVRHRGRELFALACRHDLEGIVAKLATGTYGGDRTTWLKILNATYTQREGRHELFDPARRFRGHRACALAGMAAKPRIAEPAAPRERSRRRGAAGGPSGDRTDVGRAVARGGRRHANHDAALVQTEDGHPSGRVPLRAVRTR